MYVNFDEDYGLRRLGPLLITPSEFQAFQHCVFPGWGRWPYPGCRDDLSYTGGGSERPLRADTAEDLSVAENRSSCPASTPQFAVPAECPIEYTRLLISAVLLLIQGPIGERDLVSGCAGLTVHEGSEFFTTIIDLEHGPANPLYLTENWQQFIPPAIQMLVTKEHGFLRVGRRFTIPFRVPQLLAVYPSVDCCDCKVANVAGSFWVGWNAQLPPVVSAGSFRLPYQDIATICGGSPPCGCHCRGFHTTAAGAGGGLSGGLGGPSVGAAAPTFRQRCSPLCCSHPDEATTLPDTAIERHQGWRLEPRPGLVLTHITHASVKEPLLISHSPPELSTLRSEVSPTTGGKHAVSPSTQCIRVDRPDSHIRLPRENLCAHLKGVLRCPSCDALPNVLQLPLGHLPFCCRKVVRVHHRRLRNDHLFQSLTARQGGIPSIVFEVKTVRLHASQALYARRFYRVVDNRLEVVSDGFQAKFKIYAFKNYFCYYHNLWFSVDLFTEDDKHTIAPYPAEQQGGGTTTPSSSTTEKKKGRGNLYVTTIAENVYKLPIVTNQPQKIRMSPFTRVDNVPLINRFLENMNVTREITAARGALRPAGLEECSQTGSTCATSSSLEDSDS